MILARRAMITIQESITSFINVSDRTLLVDFNIP